MKLPAVLARLTPSRIARLGLACIGAVTVGFALICLGVLLNARRDVIAVAEMEARNIASSVAQDAARNLDIYGLSLQAVVQGLQIPGVMSLDPDLRRMILFQRAARAPYFDFIDVLDANGSVVADSRTTTPRPANYAARDYFRAQRADARGPLFIGAPFLTQAGQSPTISISRRLSQPDGSFAGVVVGSMRLAYFRDLFSRLNLGAHGSIALLRSDGMVLIRLPFNANDIGRVLPADAPFYRARNGGAIDAIDPIDRERRHFLFQPIGTLPLVVSVGLADSDIYAAWRSKAVALGAAVTALSIIDLCLLLVLDYALKRRESGVAALRAGHAQLAALAAQRAAAVTAMAHASAAKTRFLAAMSHELRTPLNSILGYAELLATDDALAPLQAGRLAAMRSAGEHLRDVIDRVLDFSRVEADERPTPPERINLSALVEQCCAIAAPMADAKGLSLSTSVAPDLPSHVMANAAAIRQVLLNLLSNALKFTEKGAVAVLVTASAIGIHFAVSDTGIGVPPAQRARLFRQYDRLDADRMGVAGTGLGLAIAAQLVTHMGGRIDHQENPGGGSIFWFELPLPDAGRVPESGYSDGDPLPVRPLHVLVADDSAMNRDVAASMLRQAGHTVVQAEDGEAAVSLVAATDFDVVLMDLRMPTMGGIEATCRIRALPGGRGRTPIVAITAQESEDGDARLREAGFQGCLIKPINRRGLLSAVEAAANGSAIPWEGPPQPSPGVMAPATDALPNDIAGRHLTVFAAEIAAVLAVLDKPLPDTTEALEIAHRIAGDAAQLGFVALATAARQYVAALRLGCTQCSDKAAELRGTAAAALDALHQCNSLRRRAVMDSTKLP